MSIFVIATRSQTGRYIHGGDTDETHAREAARLRAEGLAEDCGGTIERQQIPEQETEREPVAVVEVYHVRGAGEFADVWVNVELYRINNEIQV